MNSYRYFAALNYYYINMCKVDRFCKLLLYFGLLIVSMNGFSQTHWESIILAEMEWKYLPALSEPPGDWNKPEFNDSAWQTGTGGIGYSDGDDATVITAVNSLYLRRTFNTDEADINRLILDIDYDDAFVAYLNGVEIARSPNITDEYPLFNSTLLYDREAQMYSGGLPERYEVDTAFLKDGDNLLAVHILNNGIYSSDLSSLVYLNGEVNGDDLLFYETPFWFVEPFKPFASHLPVIRINTNGQWIPDDPKIVAHMGIINNESGALNEYNDPFTDYDGQIAIEVRGQSSQMFPKKSYALETRDSMGENNNVSLLGLPAENDWILYAPYSDKSMLRNAFTFELARKLDYYASGTKFCELYINDDYKGIYILMEKIKRDKNRVDIAELLPEENSGDDLTGGYIFKVDKIDPDYVEGVSGFRSSPVPSYPNAMKIIYQYFYPKVEIITPAQKSYLKEFIIEAEEVLISGYFDDPDIGYNRYLNTGSFIDFMIMSELSKEVDKYRFSNYFHKEKNSKGGEIFAGPVWDFNLGYGNVDYWAEGLNASGWLFDDLQPHDWSMMFWWARLMEDSWFENLATTRWKYLRENEFSDDNLHAIIDSITSYLGDAITRNFQRWPILGTYVWPNYNWYGNTYDDEVDYFRNWLFARINWLDNNFTKRDLEPEVTVLPLGRNNENYDFRLKLNDDYFEHQVLKKRHFELNSTNTAMIIDSVYYENPSTARLSLRAYSFQDIGGSVFSITISDEVLNGFRSVVSENLIISGEQYRRSNSDLQIYAHSGELYIKTENPEILPPYIEIFETSGRLAGQYPIQPLHTNIIRLILPNNVYVVRVITEAGPVYSKLLYLEPNGS